MTETLYISCIFGAKFTCLYPAFEGRRCVMFSNNPQLKQEALRKGWEFELVTKFPLSKDFRESSLQSKYIKFLQFLDDYPEYQRYSNITYFDHKNVFSIEEAERLSGLMQSDKHIFMLSSREGWCVVDEMKLSSQEERYRASMKRMQDWAQGLVDAGKASWDGQIYATSFLMYRDYDAVMPFLKEVYDTLWQLKQPQCQSVWGVLSQAHKDKIQSIHWTQTSMYRSTPLPFAQDVKRKLRQGARKLLKPLFQLFGGDYEVFRKKVVLKLLSPGIK